ncbi:hypothetical protein [Streptomyces netropsis]|uniref:Uncharacterized protein n=1 Tax=Streptomyces netropsis TaxID=55404 RepID=A0A7W7LGM0_STRNE|nr:hypothetical protein [Streptomyces netropsis]MBB4889201.1 hypothetical protein [Streptomyces netropsis]GGR46694.1 hypothetical protein GCM10010219_60180 [Streptomyces netropsis]
MKDTQGNGIAIAPHVLLIALLLALVMFAPGVFPGELIGDVIGLEIVVISMYAMFRRHGRS